MRKRSEYPHAGLYLPCGRCAGCRLEYSRQWAIRCHHEAQAWTWNTFITLTYSDENLPSDGSVKPRHLQLFMKRLRKKFGDGIRFFGCGEYSDEDRPHYHAILFNHHFHDRTWWKNYRGNPLYVSDELKKLWEYGYHTIGSVSFESAGYVARYCMKKLGADSAEKRGLHPEFVRMSRSPPIGSTWLTRFWPETYRHDSVVIRGFQMKPPKAYDRWMEKHQPEVFEEVRKRRRENADFNDPEMFTDRMRVKETCTLARISQLKRGLTT